MNLAQWLRYRRFYRALVVDAGRRRQPLHRQARRGMKDQARQAAKATRKHRRQD